MKIKNLLIAVFIFLGMFHSLETWAQRKNIKFTVLSTGEGLSQKAVISMFQDTQGYIWVGTQNGLNKYDAYSFQVFRSKPGDSTTLVGNAINAIAEDSEGNIWVGTEGKGISVYNKESNTFKNFTAGVAPHTISNDNISFIHQAQDGKVWIATAGNGVDCYDPKTQKFKHYGYDLDDPTRLRSQYIKQIMSDSKGNIWIANDAGLTKVLKVGQDSVYFKTYLADYKNPKGLPNNYVKACAEAPNGMLWVASDGGVSMFNPESEVFTNYWHNPNDPNSLSNNYVKTLGVDLKGQVWIGSDGGVSVLNPESGNFDNYKADTEDPNSLSNNYIKSIYIDQNGAVWIGTDDGINLYDSNKEQFELYKFKVGLNPSEITSNNILSLYEDSHENLWVGTDKGISIYDFSTQKFVHIHSQPKVANSLTNNTIKDIHEDENGVFWIGTDYGLNKLSFSGKKYENPKVESFNYEQQGANSLSNNSIVALHEDKKGKIWVGTWGGGVNVFDKTTKQFTRYKNNDGSGVQSDQIHCIYETEEGVIWIGTRYGLSRFDETSKKFTTYLSNSSDETTISNDWVLSIGSGADGTFWVGTNGGGVNQFDPATGKFKRYTAKEGIPHEVIQSVLVADNEDVWMSSSVGLIRLDAKNDKFYLYDVRDGLQGYSFYLNCAFKNKNGQMYFGGSKGFNRFIPSNIKPNNFIPPVYVSKIQLYDEIITPNSHPNLLSKTISLTEQITLSHKDEFLKLEFVALNFRNAMKNRYEYKLEPLQKEWISTSADRRDATYTSLNPGEYTFRVRASNNDNIWNEEGATLKIIITPPWWDTPLAKILGLLSLIALSYGFYRLRTASLRAKKAELERLVAVRTDDLKLANANLQEKHEEIVVQNEELQQQAEEIASQRDKIEVQHNALEAAYQDISVVSEVGKDITGSLSIDKIFEEVYKDVNMLMDAPTFAIGVFDEEMNALNFTEIDGKGKAVTASHDELSNMNLLSVRCFSSNESIVIEHFSDKYPEAISTSANHSESIIYLPLNSKGKKIGVITVQSSKPNAYNDRHLTILETLASYAATALDNSMAYGIIKTKNKQITDSIRYAQTIQQAILPQKDRLKEAFKDYFVLFKPKDIVSGDFYWYVSVQDEQTDFEKHYVATVDCTGHGVPGAFMSMIGSRILNEVVIEKGMRSPADILELVNKSVIAALKQNQEGKFTNSDGMDLSICLLENTADNNTKITFAGAKTSLYYYEEGNPEIQRLRGDKRSIGGLQRRQEAFKDHELVLSEGDAVYLTTDGYMDQNGVINKKFGRQNFLELLSRAADMPMSSQQELLNTALMKHQEGAEQRDDITIMGIRI